MSSAQSTDHSSAAVASRPEKRADSSLAFSASKIHITPGAIANSDHQQRCGSYLIERLPSKKGKCAICRTTFTDYSEIVPDHIEPKGMGGAWRDDHPENIQAVHRRCNLQKGSKRLGN